LVKIHNKSTPIKARIEFALFSVRRCFWFFQEILFT
jgi:hypothetical protein